MEFCRLLCLQILICLQPELPLKSSEELAKEFLENNLRMFRKNYEPVTIEVPDSDDEDGPVHST